MKFQGDMLNFCDFIQVYVFTTNRHLNSLSPSIRMLIHKDESHKGVLQIFLSRIYRTEGLSIHSG